jgi:hypothetical protein
MCLLTGVSIQDVSAAVIAVATIVLVVVTCVYALESRRQARAAGEQARAMLETLAFLRRDALPEWELDCNIAWIHPVAPNKGPNRRAAILKFLNAGQSEGREITVTLDPDPPGHAPAYLITGPRPLEPVSPGEAYFVDLMSDQPPYEGAIVITARGQYGLRVRTRWDLKIRRGPDGPDDLAVEISCRHEEIIQPSPMG